MIQKMEPELGPVAVPGEAQLADAKGGQTGSGAVGGDPLGSETAKDRAATVVMAYREVDWDGVVGGENDAVAQLVSACEQHEATRLYLETQEGELAPLAQRLAEGLERFYAEKVAPRLRHEKVIRQLLAVAEPPPMAGGVADATGEDGLAPRRRPAVTVGHTMRVNTGCGNLYITVNEDETGRPFELFNHMGKAGGCAASQNEAIGRLISYSLRCGASIEPLIKQLKGISCHRPAWGEDGKISSCADGIGKALEKYHVAQQGRLDAGLGDASPVDPGGAGTAEDAAPPKDLHAERRDLTAALAASGPASSRPQTQGGGHKAGGRESRVVQGACRDCGSQLAYEEGCVKCYSCGFTECG